MLKNKFKLYLNMFVSQKIEALLIENHKLTTEKMELNEKVIILTELLNNPENIGKYVDEEGNLNFNLNEEEQQYEGGEDIQYQNNENINDENNEDIQYNNNEDIKNENINFENNENINYEEGEEEMNDEYINENNNQEE